MTRCVAEVDGRACRAAPLRGRPYCWTHRMIVAHDRTVTLSELKRLANEFDLMGGDLCTAMEFVVWALPELDGRADSA